MRKGWHRRHFRSRGPILPSPASSVRSDGEAAGAAPPGLGAAVVLAARGGLGPLSGRCAGDAALHCPDSPREPRLGRIPGAEAGTTAGQTKLGVLPAVVDRKR